MIAVLPVAAFILFLLLASLRVLNESYNFV